MIIGTDDKCTYQISIWDVFYIESVDRKSYIYTKDKVYQSDFPLYILHSQLPDDVFIRISKSCVLNVNVLEHIGTLSNSKLEATLSNGEKVCVSRTYVSEIKKVLF